VVRSGFEGGGVGGYGGGEVVCVEVGVAGGAEGVGVGFSAGYLELD